MNSPADTKANEEGGGCASGARAKIPLQSMVMTVVRQDAPLQPMEIRGRPEPVRRGSNMDPPLAKAEPIVVAVALRQDSELLVDCRHLRVRPRNRGRDLSTPLLEVPLFSGALEEERTHRNFPTSLSVLHKGAGQGHDLEDIGVSAFRKADARYGTIPWRWTARDIWSGLQLCADGVGPGAHSEVLPPLQAVTEREEEEMEVDGEEKKDEEMEVDLQIDPEEDMEVDGGEHGEEMEVDVEEEREEEMEVDVEEEREEEMEVDVEEEREEEMEVDVEEEREEEMEVDVEEEREEEMEVDVEEDGGDGGGRRGTERKRWRWMWRRREMRTWK
ncbi:hypothetical protein DUI87_16745 [Hirundo rustica rustica]|uniref:Uncharacterized protein n=1 Tax=Hirundo rustica rustica TaxID=333673 RepID=A0A3M0KJB9_HIRRU|nr:hypothetical protein DUI87_16745 [Hirundo rustica rustica]